MPGGIFICATHGLETQGEKRLGMAWACLVGPSESAVGSHRLQLGACFVQWRLPRGCGVSHQPFVPGAQVLLRGQRENETLALTARAYSSGGAKRWSYMRL